jgi:hypothetical protein
MGGRDTKAKVEVTFPNAPPGTRIDGMVEGNGLDLAYRRGSSLWECRDEMRRGVAALPAGHG